MTACSCCVDFVIDLSNNSQQDEFVIVSVCVATFGGSRRSGWSMWLSMFSVYVVKFVIGQINYWWACYFILLAF